MNEKVLPALKAEIGKAKPETLKRTKEFVNLIKEMQNAERQKRKTEHECMRCLKAMNESERKIARIIIAFLYDQEI